MSLPERDWKHLRAVQAAAIERYCTQVLRESEAIIDDESGSAHDRYLRLYRLLRDRDAALGSAFDDVRRSTAIARLAAMVRLGLVSNDEFNGFTTQTRESAVFLGELLRPRRNTGPKS